VVPFRLPWGSRGPLGAPRVASKGSTFRFLGNPGRRTCQSVILSTPLMVFAGFCRPRGCPKAPFLAALGLLGRTWPPQVADLGPSRCRLFDFCDIFATFLEPNSQSVILSNPPWFGLVFTAQVVAKWLPFWLLGLAWIGISGWPTWGHQGLNSSTSEPLGADLGPPRGRFFDFGASQGPTWSPQGVDFSTLGTLWD